jgi:hypothetical protein
MAETPENWGLLLFRIEAQEREIKDLKDHVEQLERRAVERDRERAAQERKQLMAGISFLGAMVMAMLGLIWSYRSIILRGGQ